METKPPNDEARNRARNAIVDPLVWAVRGIAAAWVLWEGWQATQAHGPAAGLVALLFWGAGAVLVLLLLGSFLLRILEALVDWFLGTWT